MSVVWFNGQLLEEHAAIPVGDRGFLLGDGVFETLCVMNGVALWLSQHLQRMERAAGELGIGFDGEAVQAAVARVLQHSEGTLEVLRLSLSRGVAPRGLAASGTSPSLLATLDGFQAANLFQPCRLELSRIRRNEFAPSSRLKTLSYVDGVMAAREVSASADDALMLNTAGNVASSTVANIFMLQQGKLITPAADQGILPGIMRGVLLDGVKLASQRGIALEELYGAEGVFLTNSLRFLRPVSHINGREIAMASLAQFEDMFRKQAQAQCGVDPGSLIEKRT